MPIPPKMANSGQFDSSPPEVRPRAVGEIGLLVPHAQRDDARVRDRERERGAERVDRAEEGGLPGQDHERPGRCPRRTAIATHGVLKRGWRRRKTSGQLPVARHRVGDPRGADHARVRGDEQDRRGQDADVELRRVEHGAVEAEVLDDAEHRIVREPAAAAPRRGASGTSRSPACTGIAESATSGSVR